VKRQKYERIEPSVLIARFSDEASAHLAAGLLEAQDIAVFLWSRMPLHGLGERRTSISVRSSDLSKAVELLKQSPAEKFLVNEQ
jgi:hypothetical protein